MDDISREPRAQLATPRRVSVKGPAEVVDAAADTVEEVRRVVFDPEPAPERLRFAASSADEVDDAADGEPDEPAEPAAPAAAEPDPEAEQAPDLHAADELARVLLALVLSQREPVALSRLAEACGATVAEVQAGLGRLGEILAAAGLPLELSAAGERAKLLTLPAVYPYVQRLKGLKRAAQLSAAALETLAVIAYRQPVIRAEIEAIRGVKAGPMLRSLLEHKLVKVVGRADVPGRPLQYGTTREFLERFGLASLKELPSVREFKSL